MRVAFINHHGKAPAGAENALSALVQHLPESIEARFFLFEEGAFATLLLNRGESVSVVPMTSRMATATRGKLRVRNVPAALKLVWELRAAIGRFGPDLIVTNTMKAHVVGSIAARLIGAPCINYVHDIPEGKARLLLQLVSRLCAAERIACSRKAAENLNLPRTQVVYPSVDLRAFRGLPSRGDSRARLGLPVDDLPLVGIVGRIARWKGQDRFIRIAERVLRRVDARFAVIGSALFGCDADFVDNLHDHIAAAGLAERVHFVPWQSDVRPVYGALDLSCNCSTREPCAITSLEALAAGVPVVCFEDAGICEIFEGSEGGVGIAVDDEAAFADAVAEALLDDQARERRSRSALDCASRVDMALISSRFAEILMRFADAPTPAIVGPAPGSFPLFTGSPDSEALHG